MAWLDNAIKQIKLERASLYFQVVERVTVFVMDANDEKPEFLNMPAITDVMEVSRGECSSLNNDRIQLVSVVSWLFLRLFYCQ